MKKKLTGNLKDIPEKSNQEKNNETSVHDKKSHKTLVLTLIVLSLLGAFPVYEYFSDGNHKGADSIHVNVNDQKSIGNSGNIIGNNSNVTISSTVNNIKGATEKATVKNLSPERTLTFSGNVYDNVSRQPIEGAEINFDSFSAKTDSTGTFRITFTTTANMTDMHELFYKKNGYKPENEFFYYKDDRNFNLPLEKQ